MFFFYMELRPHAVQGLLSLEVYRSHTTTHHPSQRPLPDSMPHMPSAGFEPTISADGQPQKYVLDGAATGSGTVHTEQGKTCDTYA